MDKETFTNLCSEQFDFDAEEIDAIWNDPYDRAWWIDHIQRNRE